MIQNDREVGWHNSGAEAGNRKGFFHDTRFMDGHYQPLESYHDNKDGRARQVGKKFVLFCVQEMMK